MLTPRAALACVALGVAMALPAAASLPAPLPAFEGARVTPVLTAARLHGIPTRIRHFAADAPLDKVRGFYRNVLGKPHLDNTIAGWSVLSLKRGDLLLPVLLLAMPHGSGGVVVSVSEAQLADPRGMNHHDHDTCNKTEPHIVSYTTDKSEEAEDASTLATYLTYHHTKHSQPLEETPTAWLAAVNY